MSHEDILTALMHYTEQELPGILETHHIPGASVLVIKDGEVIHQASAGMRNVEGGLATDTKTLFAIGSTSKAFTAVMLGQLVDEGKLHWDDPVARHIPEFRLSDPLTSMQVTVRDMLCHRTGQPRHDLAWFMSRFEREDLLRRMQYLAPFAPLRGAFCYNNLMWMAAGIIIERITGKPWEQNLQERLFEPLGMKDANSSTDATQAHSANYALPYEKIDGKLVRVPFHQIDAVGPAGSINAHIEDYGKWLMMNLNGGMVDGRALVSESSLAEIFTPQMAINPDNILVESIVRFKEFSPLVYTLGWVLQHYRGRRLLMHAGGIDGFTAFINVLPEEKTGVVVLSNLGGSNIPYAISWDLLDRAMGWETLPWTSRMAEYEAERDAKIKAGAEGLKAMQVQGTSPSHPLEAYAGTFTNGGYGDLQVKVEDGKLAGMYNHIPVTLAHFHYDTFLMHLEMPSPQVTVPVRFEADITGAVRRVLIPWEELTGEIDFVRSA